MRAALITGVNGQDGSYLAEFLLSEGYRVAGTVQNKTSNLDRISHIREYIEIVEMDLKDDVSLEKVIHRFRPDEVYNLAARTSGSQVWTDPVMTGEVNALGVTRLLEAIRNFNTGIRFCQASSSEVFGNALNVPQEETTPLRPRNPYGVAKAYAQWITANYRESHGLFAGSSILFNHESPRRALDFVARKISCMAARIKLGLAKELRLGDLDAETREIRCGTLCDRVAGEDDVSRRPHQPHNGLHERRLSGPVRTENRNDLSLADMQRCGR